MNATIVWILPAALALWALWLIHGQMRAKRR